MARRPLALALVLLITLFLAACSCANPSAPPEDARITFEQIVNQVEAERTGEQASGFLPAQIGQALLPGDAIKTLADSEARIDIVIRDLRRISRTTPNTVWRLGQFGVDRDTIIELDDGKLFVFDHTPAGGPGLQVLTPAGVAAVRGTWLSVAHESDSGLTELQCFRGVCELSNDLGTVVLTDEQKSTAVVGAAPTDPERMTDDDLQQFLQLPEARSGEVAVPVLVARPTPTPVPAAPTAEPFVVDTTGHCPQRQEAATRASAVGTPMNVILSATVNGGPHPAGTQVVVLLEHPTLGRCWTAPVRLALNHGNLALSPPDVTGWLPPRYFLMLPPRYEEIVEAEPSFHIDFFSAGTQIGVHLTAPDPSVPPDRWFGTRVSQVDTSGHCPQRTGEPVGEPMRIDGRLVYHHGAHDDRPYIPALGGVQVVTAMVHPTEGICWLEPVMTAEGGSFDVRVVPPTPSEVWFPLRFFVDDIEAYPSDRVYYRSGSLQPRLYAVLPASARPTAVPAFWLDPARAADSREALPDLANPTNEFLLRTVQGRFPQLVGPDQANGRPAIRFDGVGDFAVSTGRLPAPDQFTLSIWFRTTTPGGKLAGVENSQTGFGNQYDRHLYLSDDGRLHFGIWLGSPALISTPGPVTDGAWHHAIATYVYDGSRGRMAFYLDGREMGTLETTMPARYEGWWRIGGGNLNTWSDRPRSSYFQGDIGEFRVYPYFLAAEEVMALFSPGS